MVSALIPQFSSGLRVRNINFPFQRAAFPSKMSRGGVRLGISGFRLWNHDLGFYKKTGNQKKNFNTRNSDLGFRDFPSQPISGQSEKGYGMLS